MRNDMVKSCVERVQILPLLWSTILSMENFQLNGQKLQENHQPDCRNVKAIVYSVNVLKIDVLQVCLVAAAECTVDLPINCGIEIIFL